MPEESHNRLDAADAATHPRLMDPSQDKKHKEDRLAAALRANLRRRKAADKPGAEPQPVSKPDKPR